MLTISYISDSSESSQIVKILALLRLHSHYFG